MLCIWHGRAIVVGSLRIIMECISILGITPCSEARLTQGRLRWKANPISYNNSEDMEPKISLIQPQYPFDEQGGRLVF
ncbi:hypothetical protein LINGRAHAP2_LOCUS30263, partial [Linum grandiflorum]